MPPLKHRLLGRNVATRCFLRRGKKKKILVVGSSTFAKLTINLGWV
jgi:hypothetical protein